MTRLLRVTAWVFKFLKKLRMKKEEKIITNNMTTNKNQWSEEMLSVDDLQEAKFTWIRDNQQEVKKDAANFKQLKNSLNLFEDENNLLRCKGRLQNAPVTYDTNNPFILAKGHRLTELITDNAHLVV